MQLQVGRVEGWLRVTLLLCAFGTLREIRPSEPFVSEFLLGEWRNLTSSELYQQVYPVGTYSYLSQLVLVFLLTDFLRFKPVIIASGICGILVYCILLWTTSLEWLQVSQFVYGLYMATEVAYYTYIFAKVDSDKYPRVSSYTRMAALAGRFLSGLSAQLLTLYAGVDYRQLNYITLAAQILATFWAVWLPSVNFSVYFHRNDKVENSSQIDMAVPDRNIEFADVKKAGCGGDTADAFSLIWRHARAAYTRRAVVLWSLLYAVSTCLFVQTQYYVQILWMDMQGNNTAAYNGFVEAGLTLGGGGAAYAASLARPAWSPAALAALQATALFLATHLSNVYVSYAGYIFVGISYHYVITLTSTKIASRLSDESCFGLIFGINTLAGTALQSLLTFAVISDAGLALPIRSQYYVLCGCYATLAALWTGALLFRRTGDAAAPLT